jgi:CDP-diacylglycerol--glycerol-3-phosphate 3-phosphatidyltransferase
MPSIYHLKPRFQAVLRPVVRRMAKNGITANQVTIATMVLSVALGVAVALAGRPGLLLLYPPFLLLRMALNAIDGMLAREFARPTRLGTFLNEIGDMVSDAALYLPVALFVPPMATALTVAIVALALVGEAAGILSQATGGERRYDGPLGKSDRALAFTVVALAFGFGLPGADWWMPAVAAVLTAAAVATIVNRIRGAFGGDRGGTIVYR